MNNEIKPTDKLVKIVYSHERDHKHYLRMSLMGIVSLIAMVAIGFIIYNQLVVVRLDSTQISLSVLAEFILMFPFLIGMQSLGDLFKHRKSYRQECERFNKIKKNGRRVIGELSDFDSIETDNIGKTRKSKSFSFNLEYENPSAELKFVSTKTPPIELLDMDLRKTDFPIRVLLYVDGDNYYVDSLINPPVKKMLQRKLMRIVIWTIIIACIIATVVFSELGKKDLEQTFLALSAVSMFGGVYLLNKYML